jgi:hypothetical protein
VEISDCLVLIIMKGDVTEVPVYPIIRTRACCFRPTYPPTRDNIYRLVEQFTALRFMAINTLFVARHIQNLPMNQDA